MSDVTPLSHCVSLCLLFRVSEWGTETTPELTHLPTTGQAAWGHLPWDTFRRRASQLQHAGFELDIVWEWIPGFSLELWKGLASDNWFHSRADSGLCIWPNHLISQWQRHWIRFWLVNSFFVEVTEGETFSGACCLLVVTPQYCFWWWW